MAGRLSAVVPSSPTAHRLSARETCKPRRQSLLAALGCEEKAAEEQKRVEQQGVDDVIVGTFAYELQAARRNVMEQLELAMNDLSRRLKLALQEELTSARDTVRLESLGALLDMQPVDTPAVQPVEVAVVPATPPHSHCHEAPPPLDSLEVLQDLTASDGDVLPGGRGGAVDHPFAVRVSQRLASPESQKSGEASKGPRPPTSSGRLVVSDEAFAHRSEGDRSVLSITTPQDQDGSGPASRRSSASAPVEGVASDGFGSSSSDESADRAAGSGGGGIGSSISRETSRSRDPGIVGDAKGISFAADVDLDLERESLAARRALGRSGTYGSEGTSRRDNDSVNLLAFEVLDCWKKNRQLAAKLGNKLSRKTVNPEDLGIVSDSDSSSSEEEDEDEEHKDIHRAREGWFRHIIVHPNSVKRGVWEVSSLLMVIYDIIWIPFQLFEPPATSFSRVMDWVTRLFWTCDISASFATGYLTTNGSVEMRPRKIWMRYFRSWFFLDIFVVSVDWLEIFFAAAQGGGYFRFGRAARAFRIVRMVRLLRLLRVKEVISVLFESVQSETIKEMSQMIKIVLLILMSGHLFACFWYGIGDWHVADKSWVAMTFNEGSDPLIYRYSASLHWSLSQYTGGMDEIRPVNVVERGYAIVVLTFTLMVGTVLVSSLTSSMTHLNILANEKKTKMTMLRKYLGDNRITNRLTVRVTRNAQHSLREQQQYIPEAHVDLLQLVSEPLRMELHFEIYAPILKRHPFFEEYIETCPHIVHKICHQAPSMVGVSRGDIIFNVGEIPPKPKMIMLTSGTLTYVALSRLGGTTRQSTRRSMAAPLGAAGASELEPGQWVAEAALWTLWMHRGILTAKNDARMCLLDAERFQNTVTAFDHDEFNPKIYAAGFVEGLNRCDDELTDLAVGIEVAALQRLQHHMDRLAEQKFVNMTSRGRRKGSVHAIATFG